MAAVAVAVGRFLLQRPPSFDPFVSFVLGFLTITSFYWDVSYFVADDELFLAFFSYLPQKFEPFFRTKYF